MKVHFKLLFIGLALWSCSKEEETWKGTFNWWKNRTWTRASHQLVYFLLYDFDYKQFIKSS